ncbi:MAG: agmatine deiminase family protein [Bacteroidota bacterium]
MRIFYLFLLLCFSCTTFQTNAQESGLPAGFAPFEKEAMSNYLATNRTPQNGITTPPTSPVRTMAEWEEIQSLVITWTGYISVLREIVRYAKDHAEVIIVCSNAAQVVNYLAGFGIDTQNVTLLEEDFDSIWVRDYGQNSVYTNDVDSLILVDWIYNRPRPEDDLVPEAIAALKGLPLYSTTAAPTDLVHTGGNFMSDGMGNAFSSELVLEENGPGGFFNVTIKDEAQVDQIMHDFMGINNYIKMTALPYDGINHIDMHMKLLNEETLIIGEYPQGVADGPQIEANIQYVLSNFTSTFGTPYDIVRIQMPPDGEGHYPDHNGGGWNAGDYRTYTNMVFVNKLILVPVYEEQYDTTALNIIREAMPGYQVEGIECNDIIQALGAIHCITKAVGVEDPLWIVHQELDDTQSTDDYQVDATIKHKSGISSAFLYYEIDGSGVYNPVPMTLTDVTTDTWTGFIPGQDEETTIRYYVQGLANSGKSQVRPLVAPDGYFQFDVDPLSTSIEDIQEAQLNLDLIYPNPAGAITVVPVSTSKPQQVRIEMNDALGRLVAVIHDGQINAGSQNFFLQADRYPAGSYLVSLISEQGVQTQKLLIK